MPYAMPYAMSQLSALFNIGLIICSVALCIIYYASAKRTKVFMPSCSLPADGLYGLIKTIPNHVWNHKVKGIKASGSSCVQLGCSTVKIVITQNASEIKCVYKLKWFINLLITLTFGLFGLGGVGVLFEGNGSEGVVAIAIAFGIHVIRGKVLNQGRNIVVSLEEHLR